MHPLERTLEGLRDDTRGYCVLVFLRATLYIQYSVVLTSTKQCSEWIR